MHRKGGLTAPRLLASDCHLWQTAETMLLLKRACSRSQQAILGGKQVAQLCLWDMLLPGGGVAALHRFVLGSRTA